jgi:hypothetical protein
MELCHGLFGKVYFSGRFGRLVILIFDTPSDPAK